MTRQRERQLALNIQAGCEASCAELVQSNLSFVVKVASKYRNIGMPFEDLLNEGNLGLVEAARRYDPSVGTKFITYAIWWIRKRILKALGQQAKLVHIPSSQFKKVREIRSIERSLTGDLGTKPTREEISARMGKALPSVERTLQLEQQELSLDHRTGEQAEQPLSDRLADDRSVNPEGCLIDRESIALATEALQQLNEQERQVIVHRFGISRSPRMTLQEIGDLMNISRERVRQIEQRAKVRLQRIVKSRMKGPLARSKKPE